MKKKNVATQNSIHTDLLIALSILIDSSPAFWHQATKPNNAKEENEK